jgi:hypothetical protein
MIKFVLHQISSALILRAVTVQEQKNRISTWRVLMVENSALFVKLRDYNCSHVFGQLDVPNNYTAVMGHRL